MACDFNPRSRVGNDDLRRSGRRYRLRFQSTFPRGERPGRHSYSATWHVISIHVPAWGTTYDKSISKTKYSISIHVPAWGTTFHKCFSFYIRFISIHVPAWGTTRVGIWTKTASGFQSTFPRGERLIVAFLPRQLCNISIHVPAWGTTGKF